MTNFPPKLSTRADLLQKFIYQGGVIIPWPDNVWISPEVEIGRNTIIYPNSYLIGDANSSMGESCEIGPNAFLRGWFKIGDRVKIGFGAEIVRSSINDGSKTPHSCHVGDGIVGKDCNVAFGVVFCNFGGEEKNITIVEDDVFIGAGVLLIPSVKCGLRLGAGSFIGAGEVINRDVPPQSVIYAKRSLPIHAEMIAIKENGKWKIISHTKS